MKTTTREAVVQPQPELKQKGILSRMTVAAPPISAEPVASIAPPIAAEAIGPTKKEARPRLAARSAMGITWRSVAITAGITAVPIALRFLIKPRSKRGKAMLSAITSIFASLPANYMFQMRPLFHYWGATVDEAKRPLPGDDLVKNPNYTATFATTIEATPAEIWPWLVQMGQNKGGFYSYDWLENLIGLQLHNAERIMPEWQQVKEGDKVRVGPQEGAVMKVAVFKPEQAFVLYTGVGIKFQFVWAFTLFPIDAHSTRLVVRMWGGSDTVVTNPGNTILSLLPGAILEPIVFIMQRKMNLGIKQRAERTN